MLTVWRSQLLAKAIVLVVFGGVLMALGWPFMWRENPVGADGGKWLFIIGELMLGAGAMMPFRRPVVGAILAFFTTGFALGSYDGVHLIPLAVVWVAIFAVYAGIIMMLFGPGKTPIHSR
jgi:hypothetical protein